MEVLVRDRAVRSNVVESRHAGFASHLVDEFGLPEEHDVLLMLCGFFDFGCVKLAWSLLLFNFENFAEGTTAQLLDDFEAAFKNFLSLV